jgi:hypothetical protein
MVSSTLAARDRAFVSTWPGVLRTNFEAYHRHSGAPVQGEPHWLAIPRELAGVLSAMSHPAGSRIDDAMWGAYCAFVTARLQEEGFGAHRASPALIFIADQYAVEAVRAFAACVRPDSTFWPSYARDRGAPRRPRDRRPADRRARGTARRDRRRPRRPRGRPARERRQQSRTRLRAGPRDRSDRDLWIDHARAKPGHDHRRRDRRAPRRDRRGVGGRFRPDR